MLQMDALRNLPLESKSRVLNQIDFTAIYVAADSSWSSLFSDNEDFVVPENFKHLIAFAIFNVYLNFAILDTLEELADEALNDDPSLIRFFIPRSTTEGRLAPALASVWMLDGVTPTYFILRAKLSERLNDIAIISNKVKFGAFSSEKDCILSHPFLSLRYEFSLKNTIDVINNAAGSPQRRWCVCFDELEIVPERLRETLYRNLRSSDQRILFKISLSPFSIDPFVKGDPNSPMPGQDYTEIYLSYPRSADAMRFGRELVNYLLLEAGLTDRRPEAIFGSSGVAAAEPNDRAPVAAYAAPNGERYRLLADLRDSDPSFRKYLNDRHYDIEKMPSMAESKRAELRKLLQICRARIEFRHFGDANGSDDRPGFRRSRKRIHLMYTGLESLLAICEGNPRWIIGILRPQVLRFQRLLSHGNRNPLDKAYQARQILKVIGRYRALLGTIPLRGAHKETRASVLRLIDQIGNFMFRDVVLGTFKPEPVLSFTVDKKVTASQIEALGIAINQGAFVLVPNRKGDTTSGTILNSRFRISYLLAPDFQLPLTYGAPINLSTILQRPNAQAAQMRLEEL